MNKTHYENLVRELGLDRAENDNDLLAVTEEDALIYGQLATLAALLIVVCICALLMARG
ncbi:hypothetical protein RSW49_23125 [Escherichia coli]|uniref:hypothetical protein n=1 Tax=Enterobacteriaceae TaxID=543 RepID=UPI001FF18012|nr:MULTISPECIES: hypothetical protein [Enterobacteriaceae]MDT9046450.1 hypothetical protein [Escherichia coli]MDT9105836.1 hypothetical protein [Escherichia coli]UOV84402.1 hypothetical protein MU320_29085 [Klebsiella pneumoniae]